jgi:BASS family bile acid:Na+ symporter
MGSEAGLAIVLAVLFLALAAWSHDTYRQFSFTVWVFVAVAAAMFYPQYLREIGGQNTQSWIVPIVQIIMFCMGTTLKLTDFGRVARQPRGVLIGVISQFMMMPFIAFGLAVAFRFPAEVAAGIVLVGSAPSGVASNVMTFIAKGNLALSVTLTAFATLLAPVMTPLLMKSLAGQFVTISFYSMMMSIFNMVLLPIGAALLLTWFLRGRAAWLLRPMPFISMAMLIFVLAFITAAGRDNLLAIGPLLMLTVLIHNGLGYLLGYRFARLAKLDERSSRTVAIEVGMQNGGLAAGLAVEMGRAATMGLAPAVFSSWQNVSGSILANWWRSRPVKDDPLGDRSEVEPTLQGAATSSVGRIR